MGLEPIWENKCSTVSAAKYNNAQHVWTFIGKKNVSRAYGENKCGTVSAAKNNNAQLVWTLIGKESGSRAYRGKIKATQSECVKTNNTQLVSAFIGKENGILAYGGFHVTSYQAYFASYIHNRHVGFLCMARY